MSSSSVSALVKRLTAASYAYHNGLPLTMSDAEYDDALERLRDAQPDHPFLSHVGAPVAAGDEVALPFPLPSLNKIKDADAIVKWTARCSAAEFHVSVKLDGCSALWLPASRKLFTRGDGMRGRDVSAFVPFFRGFPTSSAAPARAVRGDLSSAAPATAVRGELIMRTDSPAIPEGKLARNIVAGALNRTATDSDLFREIRFVAYEVVEPAGLTPTQQFALLRSAGYEVAHALSLPKSALVADRLSAEFTHVESHSPYQLDGIVVAPDQPLSAPTVRKGAAINPDDRVAWKTRQTANTANTIVRAVEWNVSAGGLLIPRVLFDPVVLSGATITAATGLHGRWITENGVGPGAVIEVRRAGDVIPQIIAVHVAAPDGPAMPTVPFAWTDSVHVRAATETTESACVRITRALAELGAENVGPGVVAKLYMAGFTTVGAIYRATAAEFAARVEGCKEKSAERIWNGLRVKQTTWTELDMLCASCAMPRGIGHTRLAPLLAQRPDPRTWTADLTSEGISPTTMSAIVAAVPAYLTWRTANFPTWTPPSTAAVTATAAPAAGAWTVVFTGIRDKALEAHIAAAGHVVADSVSKKTTHVVHPDGPAPTSTKITKARELGARILSVSEFRAML